MTIMMQPTYVATHRVHQLQGFFGEFLRPGDLCFDIGANYGEKTAVFLSLGASVIAVEPQKNVVSFLQQSFPNAIAKGKLVIIPKGLDCEEGVKELRIINDYGNCMSTFSDDFVEVIVDGSGGRWQVTSVDTVELTTLDSLIQTFGLPRYCKIDVEGLDYQVLQGLSTPIELLSFEYNTKGKLIHKAEDCIHYVSRLDHYEFNYETANHQFTLPHWVPADVMTYILRHELGHADQFGDIFARRVHATTP